MINMLKISKHGIQTITPHMDIMASPKKVETMNQMLSDRSPVEIRVTTNFIVVLHLASSCFIIVVDKGLAVVEMRKLVCKVSRAFFVEPAACKRVVIAAKGFRFRG
jgi:hypothetical protein